VINEGLDPHGILVPQNAVGRDAKSQPTVLVVDAQNTTRLTVITTGRMTGGDWQVLGGLKPGDKVVVQGLMQLMGSIGPDTKVTPVPAKAPDPAAASGTQ
jgi:membrane fusion protein (multidrug efflux system)